MKTKTVLATCGVVLSAFLAVQNVSAVVTYETGSNVQFTFNPELSLSISADFVIDNLVPDTSKDSNVVVATVTTNSVAGYELSATVGNTTYNSTSLISSNNDTIAMMGSGASLSSGTWGYTLDGGTTYGALDTASSTILRKTTTSGGGSTNIQIGAYAASNQATGEYKNVMNFAVVANPIPVIYSIPNLQAFASMTAAQKAEVLDSMEYDKTYTVTDARDGQTYEIAKLRDGKVWMTTNLNLGAVTLTDDLTSDNTNLSTTIAAATFNSYKKTTSAATYTAAEYIPAIGNDNTTGGPGTPYGTMYNYCAVSAGTICTQSNLANATYDICPAGWRLPTGGTGGEFDVLYNNSAYGTYEKMHAPVSEGGAAFAFTGSFYGGSWSISSTRPGGIYWSSTAYPELWEDYPPSSSESIEDYTAMYNASISGYNSRFYPGDIMEARTYGFAARCVLK